jgi:hypothetical protein
MAAALGREVSAEDIFCAVQKDHDAKGLLTRNELSEATIAVLRVLSHTEISQAQAEALTQRALEEVGAGPDGISLGEFERAVRLPIQQDRDATRFPRTLLVAVLPVLYGISTRIGFVTLPMHAVASGLSLQQVGMVLGLFQLQRALANWVIVKQGSSATFALVSLSFCGFAFSVVWPHHWLSCWAYTLTGLGEIIVSLQHEMLLLPCMAANPASLKEQFKWVCLGACIAFVAGSALLTYVGFHAACLLGAISSLTTLSLGAILCWVQRRRTSFSPYINFPPDAFGLRPFAVGVGSLIAMSHVSVPCDQDMPTNQTEMISKVESLLAMSLDRVPLDRSVIECCVASIMSVQDADDDWQFDQDDCNVVSGCLHRFRYLPISLFPGQSARHRRPEGAQEGRALVEDKTEVLAREPLVRSSSSSSLQMVRSSSSSKLQMVRSNSNSKLQIETQQAPWIVYPFLFSQVFIAMCIGTFLGTGGLYLAQTYGVSVFVFGASMGLGELLGMLTSAMVLKKSHCAPMQGLPSASINLLLSVMVAITVVILLFSAMPHVLGAIFFQLTFQVLNDVWTYVVNDIVHRLSPVSLYRRLQGQGQMYRRVGNAVAGLFGPILMEACAPLPFIVAALLLLAWTVVLAIIVWHHGQRGKAQHSSPQLLGALKSWRKDMVQCCRDLVRSQGQRWKRVAEQEDALWQKPSLLEAHWQKPSLLPSAYAGAVLSLGMRPAKSESC